MTRVLVTGATGFVGRTLCELLVHSGYTVRAALRNEGKALSGAIERVMVGDVATADWTGALVGVDFVIHAAARAHVVRDSDSNSSVYFATNLEGTRRLASAAAAAGVRRLVYVSSIKVNGEENDLCAYTPGDEPHPLEVYGESKWEAEKALLAISAGTALEAVIIRPPLVYGPGVRANFLRLLGWVDKKWPLPLGAIRNRRSLVSVWNLCDLLEKLLTHPRAPGRAWMVSDGQDLSTPELVKRIGKAMDRRVSLLPVPVSFLGACARLTGHAAEVRRLCGSLCVDIGDTRTELGWSPVVSVDEALSRTVAWYLAEIHGNAR
jgi:nucleoside-diphosphate-sugar epimerase